MISTKERIKQAALSLFAKKGYDGTSMSDLAAAVQLNKASIYSHYAGKLDLFLAVYQDAANDYEALNTRLFEESKQMNPYDKLRHIFEGYIVYYYKNKDMQAFWSQILLFTPGDLQETIHSDMRKRDHYFQTRMEHIFSEAMEHGMIRHDQAARLVMTFRAMREGLLTWMRIIPDLKEEWIHTFWSDLWLGLEKRD